LNTPSGFVQRQERTFISFSDEATLRENFPSRGFRVPAHRICPITRLPAKYFDPVTELPYANLQVYLPCFSVLRIRIRIQHLK
jgi:vacuolar protein sorting-associated protein 72